MFKVAPWCTFGVAFVTPSLSSFPESSSNILARGCQNKTIQRRDKVLFIQFVHQAIAVDNAIRSAWKLLSNCVALVQVNTPPGLDPSQPSSVRASSWVALAPEPPQNMPESIREFFSLTRFSQVRETLLMWFSRWPDTTPSCVYTNRTRYSHMVLAKVVVPSFTLLAVLWKWA